MALTALKYQVKPIRVLREALDEKSQALCVMAMGLGKTVVSAFVVEEYLNVGQRGLFLCHNNYILGQVEKEYRGIIGNHIKYSTFYGEEKDWYADNAQMLFASFQSMNNHHAEWYKVFDPNHFDFLVVDESHHGQAETYRPVIEYFNCKKLGLTGTPDREDGLDIRDLFGEEVVNIPLEVGIARGWLTNIEYHVLSDGINNKKLKQILARVLKGKERVSVKQLNETIFINARTDQQRLILNEYSEIKNRSQGKKTMIFCENIDHAEHVANFFDNAGVIHSKRPKGENQKALDGFKSGELQYLISVDKLNEGIDVPNVEVEAFLRATDSERVWYQQTGRGARRAPGKEKLVILDFVANIERLLMIRELLDRIEKEIEQDEELKAKLSKRNFNVSGEGFEFNFSDDLVNLLEVIKVLKGGFYKTWQEASDVAIKLGFVNNLGYRHGYKIDPKLPSVPSVLYPDFPGWPAFLGKKIAPEGWMTPNQISSLPDIMGNDDKIKRVAEDYRQEHPEWFKDFQSGTWFIEHYHPDLVQILKKRCARVETAPEGWMTPNQISLRPDVQSGNVRIAKLAENYRTEHPEWFKFYMTGSRSAEYCHPDLVKILIDQCRRKEEAPEGWMTPNQIRDLPCVARSSRTISEFAENHRTEHPEWFRDFKSGPFFGEHYHPDLVKILIEHCGPKETAPVPEIREKAPEGWMTAGSISRLPEVIGEDTKIRKLAESYRTEHPEWFKHFMSGVHFKEHYHPDLVKILKEHCAPKETAPLGWMTAKRIASLPDIQGGHSKIKRVAEEYRQEHPEWFKDYMAGPRYAEHYHPDLVKILKKRCKKPKQRAKK